MKGNRRVDEIDANSCIEKICFSAHRGFLNANAELGNVRPFGTRCKFRCIRCKRERFAVAYN